MSLLKVGRILKVKVSDLDYKADGIVKIDNMYLYIPGLLKGEEASVEILSVKKHYATAKVIEIIKKSEDRVSDTSIFGSLNLIHLSFEKQLKWQKDITKKTLDKVLNNNINVLNTITDNNDFHYRNKVVFHTFYDKGLKLGLFANNNQSILEVNNFLLAPKIVNEIVLKLNESNFEIKDKDLINISFKTNLDNEVLVTLVSKSESFLELEKLIAFFKKFREVKGITLNLKMYKEKILSEKSILLYGTNILNEGILLLNDQSFLQVNSGVASKVYKLIKDNILGTKIVDAYSGVGSIGFNIYNKDLQVTMIENSKANLKLANIIKENNNFSNVNIILANAEDVIKDYKVDTIILDPPRKGLMSSLINEVISNNIKRVIYLSCDLQSLARDLKIFNNYYNILKVYPIKMFPQTNSFETLVVLNKKDV